MAIDANRVQDILRTVPVRYRGPGGAIAVLHQGVPIAQLVWGYADMEKRVPMTSEVLIPICSITKQFVAMLLMDLTENPPSTNPSDEAANFHDRLNAKLREVLRPKFVDEAGLNVENLVDMCSGIRDYWALCTVQGSRPETIYSIQEHNPGMLRRQKSLHFEPASEYSYSNTNFNAAERVIELATKDTLQNLLAARVFGPAKMKTARLGARTDRLPAPIVGYEGSEKFGFFPAPNFIEWSADAGIVASLDDMIAYEQYFDAKYTNESKYRELVQPRKYKNGKMAKYRYGLRHFDSGKYISVGHGGALRGFKLHRRYVPKERLSVVVLYNHSASASGTADYILKQILNISEESSTIEPAQEWFGSYLDKDTQLAVRVTSSPKPGKINLTYVRAEETLDLIDTTHARTEDIEARIEGDTLHVYRSEDNRVLQAERLSHMTPTETKSEPATPSEVRGVYTCEETESTMTIEGVNGMLYALFDGAFGRGPPHLMTHLGKDVWIMADPRAMDDQPPGDWTLVFECDEHTGNASRVTVGCWLARRLEFVKKVT